MAKYQTVQQGGFEAVWQGETIPLANKELLVCAGCGRAVEVNSKDVRLIVGVDDGSKVPAAVYLHYHLSCLPPTTDATELNHSHTLRSRPHSPPLHLTHSITPKHQPQQHPHHPRQPVRQDFISVRQSTGGGR